MKQFSATVSSIFLTAVLIVAVASTTGKLACQSTSKCSLELIENESTPLLTITSTFSISTVDQSQIEPNENLNEFNYKGLEILSFFENKAPKIFYEEVETQKTPAKNFSLNDEVMNKLDANYKLIYIYPSFANKIETPLITLKALAAHASDKTNIVAFRIFKQENAIILSKINSDLLQGINDSDSQTKTQVEGDLFFNSQENISEYEFAFYTTPDPNQKENDILFREMKIYDFSKEEISDSIPVVSEITSKDAPLFISKILLIKKNTILNRISFELVRNQNNVSIILIKLNPQDLLSNSGGCDTDGYSIEIPTNPNSNTYLATNEPSNEVLINTKPIVAVEEKLRDGWIDGKKHTFTCFFSQKLSVERNKDTDKTILYDKNCAIIDTDYTFVFNEPPNFKNYKKCLYVCFNGRSSIIIRISTHMTDGAIGKTNIRAPNRIMDLQLI